MSHPSSESKYLLQVRWSESLPAHHQIPESWSILVYCVKHCEIQGEGRRRKGSGKKEEEVRNERREDRREEKRKGKEERKEGEIGRGEGGRRERE